MLMVVLAVQFRLASLLSLFGRQVERVEEDIGGAADLFQRQQFAAGHQV